MSGSLFRKSGKGFLRRVWVRVCSRFRALVTPPSDTLPPGPRWPAVVQTVMLVVAPVRFGRACLRRYGPLFTTRFLGFGKVVYVCTPEGIRRILRDEAENFDAVAANKSIEFVLGEHSLLMSQGTVHTARRRVLMRPLHGSNVADYVDLMTSIVEQEIRQWKVNSTVKLHECFQRVTLEVMMRAVFGITDSSRLDRLRVLVPLLLDINHLIILVSRLRRSFGGFGPWARVQRLLREVDDIIFAEIRQRRADPSRRGSDVLSLLLADGVGKTAVTDREVRDHLVTLLVAGHETTSTQLAWFFERVLRTPDALERVVAAASAQDWKVLDAAIYEAMRVRPTTMDLARVAVRPWQSDGYVVPAGTMVAVSLGLLHLSPELHHEPEAYSLDRFFPVAPPSTHFLPFGGGSHRCIGSSLAMIEMRTIISTILRHVRLDLTRASSERVWPKGPMLVPRRGAEVLIAENHLTRRSPSVSR